MSDMPSAYPPPPPPNIPPPAFQAQAWPSPVYQPPPGSQGPIAPDHFQPYRPQQPIAAAAVFAGGSGAILYQFGGAALASIIAGVVSIAMPFVADRYFVVLPVAGLLGGVRAIQRGRPIGGAVGVGVNVLGGLVSLLASGLLG